MLPSEIQTAELDLALARTPERKAQWFEKWAENIVLDLKSINEDEENRIVDLENATDHMEGVIERAKEWVEELFDKLEDEALSRKKLTEICEALERCLNEENE
jgi:DNA polymerase II small subunit/DNA polymerase delta subunit B